MAPTCRCLWGKLGGPAGAAASSDWPGRRRWLFPDAGLVLGLGVFRRDVGLHSVVFNNPFAVEVVDSKAKSVADIIYRVIAML